MDKESTKWQTGAFFICEKCGRRDDAAPGAAGFAELAKAEFKSRLRELGRGKEIRVMVSGCLGNCPKKRQAAAWLPVDGSPKVLTFLPSEKEEVFEWLKKRS